jgi:alpha-L-fucosidase 2
VGWSLAWNSALWARLGNASHASDALHGLFERTLFPNLMSSHPRPKQENVFQIDANFGGAAAIAEMLLQSHAGEIELLPALPGAWSEGSFRGLPARGGFSVSAAWRAGRLANAEITATQTGPCQVRSAQPFRVTRNGIEIAASTARLDSNQAVFPAEAGSSYQILPVNPETK